MKKIILSFICLFFFLSCVEESSNQQNTSVENPNPDTTSASSPQPDIQEPDINADKLYLYSLYATSSAASSNPIYIFDDNNSTIWQSAKGAAPDEGIFLRFPSDQVNYIQSIRVIPAEGNQLATIHQVLLYLNEETHSTKSGKANEKIVLEDEIQTLYIRIFNTNLDEAKIVEEKNLTRTIHTFPKEKSIGIAAIEFYDKEEKLYQVIAPKIVKGQINASTVLAPETVYGANHLIDARTQTAWVEGSTGLAKGEFITITLAQSIGVSGLWLWNGFQRSKEHFKTNSSVKEFDFGLTDSPSATFSLRNTKAGQFFELKNKVISNQFTLSIKDAYKGKKYEDVALSELILMDYEQAIYIDTDFEEQLAANLKQQLQNTPLANRLNRRLMNTLEYKFDDLLAERSLTLHENGTFVYYSKDFTPSNEEEVYLAAEGQWVILEKQSDKVRVRVLGNYRTYSEVELRQSGQKASDLNQIFSEVWTFRNNSVEGQDILEEIVY